VKLVDAVLFMLFDVSFAKKNVMLYNPSNFGVGKVYVKLVG